MSEKRLQIHRAAPAENRVRKGSVPVVLSGKKIHKVAAAVAGREDFPARAVGFFQHKHLQSLFGGFYGGSQPGCSRADDNQAVSVFHLPLSSKAGSASLKQPKQTLVYSVI